MEINLKTGRTVRDVIALNLEIFYKLDIAGVKSINSAIDLLFILNTYDKHDWIKDECERKNVVATRCNVSKKTVENALNLLNQPLVKASKLSS